MGKEANTEQWFIKWADDGLEEHENLESIIEMLAEDANDGGDFLDNVQYVMRVYVAGREFKSEIIQSDDIVDMVQEHVQEIDTDIRAEQEAISDYHASVL